MQKHHYTISNLDVGKRLDRFFAAYLSEISREKIKRAIQSGQCNINGIIVYNPAERVKIGQSLELSLESPLENIIAEDGEIDIIWHDEHVLICNKPAGITVHPCPSCPSGTYIQRIASHYPILLKQEGLRPGIVHRLDKDTSGLMLIALTEAARLKLSDDFAQRRVQKSYLALVHGIPPEQGEVKEPIGRHPQVKVKMAIVEQKHGGREAHSTWKRLYTDPKKRFSLIEVEILTGRTHQIRVHMSHLGFPLLGDKVYGHKNNTQYEQNIAKRQMLHAYKIAFTHPKHHDVRQFCIAPPEDMLDCALDLSENLQKIIIVGLPGCGKSTLLQKFAAKDIPTFSADSIVKNLYKPGAAGHTYLLKRFGSECIAHAKAEINREALRNIMQDASIRQEVNNFIHSLVYDVLQKFWEQSKDDGHIVAVAEIPLYLENGRPYAEDTYIVGVECDQNLRYARLQHERKWSEQKCHSMDSWQWPQAKKMAACNSVINNNQNIEIFDNYTEKILEQIIISRQERKLDLAKHLQNLLHQVCLPSD